jgi:probable F420-dependent oxidoreductase
MRLGLALPHYDTSLGGRPASWEGVARVARLAEESGFSSVWMSDHLFLDWSKYGGQSDPQGSLECWTTLSALAAITDRVRLGSLTLCNDLRNPALLAKMAATLDLLSGGRLEVGLGGGWYEPEYVAAGIPFDPPGDRIRRVGEAIEIVRRLLSGEEVAHKGRYYTVDGAVCRPGPRQEPHPPLWIGGKGDLLLEIAARHADGWNFSWLGADFNIYRERAARANRACEAVGRDPAGLRRTVGVFALVGTDEADVKRRFERLVSVTPPGVLQSLEGSQGVSWNEFRLRNLAGTAEQVAGRLRELERFGVEEVIVTLGTLPFQLADETDVELVGKEIASAFG